MENLLKTNSITIIGTLKDVVITNGVRTTGDKYVKAVATVTSVIKGVTNEFEISFISSELTQEKKQNQLYATYSNMSTFKGKKVEISGSLRENRYFSTRSEQIVSTITLNGRFIRTVVDSTEDCAKFELGGFLVKSLTERKNKAGEIYLYEVVMGIANYQNDNMSSYTLHVRPTDKEIINGLSNYAIGQTFSLNGTLNFITQTITREDDSEGGFGQKVVRTFTNRQHNLWIEGGSAVVTDPDMMYSGDLVRSLVAAFKAKDVELSANAKNKVASTSVDETPSAPVVTQRQTSLI